MFTSPQRTHANEHGVPLWFPLVRIFSAIYLLKVGRREAVIRKDANRRKTSACQLPMIREDVGDFHGSKQRVFARDI
jgi:hypothetical protein